jgi:hypothetical protein
MSVWFDGEELAGTRIIGEDGPHDLCPGAPADIVPHGKPNAR